MILPNLTGSEHFCIGLQNNIFLIFMACIVEGFVDRDLTVTQFYSSCTLYFSAQHIHNKYIWDDVTENLSAFKL